jgi:hypothetical protein
MGAYQHPDLVALDEVEDLLQAYAEVRLSPSGAVLARMRRALIVEAAAASAARELSVRAAAERRPRWKALHLLLVVPRVRIPAAAFALGFAVVLGGGTGAAVLGAPAGSPFYNARVALEQLLLPTEVDARLAAHEEHLAARLADAEAAAARGDAGGLAAALAAFDAEVALAVAEIGDDTDRLAALEVILARHVAVLTALQSKVPAQASIDNALENSQKALGYVKEKAKTGKPPKPADVAPTRAPGGPPEDPGRP